MRSCARMLLILSFFVIPLCGWGQETAKSETPDLLARLSYQSTTVIQRDGFTQVCVAISRDGEYRMIRQTNDHPMMTRLHGTLSKEQFDELSKMLESPKFKALTGNRGALILQDAETFTAEILPMSIAPDRQEHGGVLGPIPQPRRFQWLNADDKNPFPDSVAKIVSWLQYFQPKDGKEFEYAEFPDVCPSGGLRRIQPTVAENRP